MAFYPPQKRKPLVGLGSQKSTTQDIKERILSWTGQEIIKHICSVGILGEAESGPASLPDSGSFPEAALLNAVL